MVSKKAYPDKIKCPICKRVINIPDGYLNKYPYIICCGNVLIEGDKK